MSEGEAGDDGGQGEGGGGGDLSWQSMLPEDLRPNVKDYAGDATGISKLVADHARDQEHIRRKGVVMPAWDDPEDVNRFRTELGRPEKPADYKYDHLEIPQEATDALEQAQQLQPLVDLLHEGGLSQKDFERVFKGYMEMYGSHLKAQSGAATESREAALKELREDWGQAFDPKVDLANRAMQTAREDAKLGDVVLDKKLADGTSLRDDPDMIRLWNAIGSKMSEGSLLGGKGRTDYGHNSPEVAKMKLAKLETENRDAIFFNAQAPGREAILKERSKLIAEIQAGETGGR